MSTIVLFHSALGLNAGVRAFADVLRADGHEVITPDLFDGEVFDNLDDGVAKRDALGIPELVSRAFAAVEGLPTDVYYAGFSMGAASAQMLAGSRPGAKGCILMHAALPLQMMGIESWPEDVPVQFFATKNDPWVSSEMVEAVKAVVPDFTQTWYEGDQHLFADADSADYLPEAAADMLGKVRAFVKDEALIEA